MELSRDDWRRDGKSWNRGHHDRDDATSVGETSFVLALERQISTGNYPDKKRILVDARCRKQT